MSGKGSAFERQVCTALSLWLSDGKDRDIFWRTSASGARATVRGGSSLKHAAGDVAAVKPMGFVVSSKYFIECKFYRELQLANFLVGRKSKLMGFWTLACRQALRYDLAPLVIARQNRMPTVILMEPESWREFGLDKTLPKLHSFANRHVVVNLLEEFLRNARSPAQCVTSSGPSS